MTVERGPVMANGPIVDPSWTVEPGQPGLAAKWLWWANGATSTSADVPAVAVPLYSCAEALQPPVPPEFWNYAISRARSRHRSRCAGSGRH